MKQENKDKILHILKGIACRKRINGNFLVREADLNKIAKIAEEDINGREK